MLLEKFVKAKLIHPPDWLISNCHFLANAGSYAYGTQNEFSDIDIFGFCTPKLGMIFPHLEGHVGGFGTPPQKFDRWSEQHIIGEDGKEYDFCVLNIVNFLELCRKNNPDQLAVLFVNRENIRHITSTGEIIRANRKKFLSKQCFWRFRGYACSQLNSAEKESPIIGSKRYLIRQKHGFDSVFLSHLYRLMFACEQILLEGDWDLTRNKDKVISVKNGMVSLQEAKLWFAEKEKYLEKLVQESKLPDHPDESEIKCILLNALENHYGNLDKTITKPSTELEDIQKIKQILAKY